MRFIRMYPNLYATIYTRCTTVSRNLLFIPDEWIQRDLCVCACEGKLNVECLADVCYRWIPAAIFVEIWQQSKSVFLASPSQRSRGRSSIVSSGAAMTSGFRALIIPKNAHCRIISPWLRFGASVTKHMSLSGDSI